MTARKSPESPTQIYGWVGALALFLVSGLLISRSMQPHAVAPMPSPTGRTTEIVEQPPAPEPESTPAPTPAATPDWRESFPKLRRTTWGHVVEARPRPEGYMFRDPPDLTPRTEPRMPVGLQWWQPGPERAFEAALEVFEAGRDGMPLLTLAAREGHLEAAFLAWFWDSRDNSMSRLLAKRDSRELLDIFGSEGRGIPKPLWAEVSSVAAAEATEVLVRGFSKHDRSQIGARLWPGQGHSALRVTLLELVSFEVVSQHLEPSEEGYLVLRVRVKATLRVRVSVTSEERSQDTVLVETLYLLSPLRV